MFRAEHFLETVLPEDNNYACPNSYLDRIGNHLICVEFRISVNSKLQVVAKIALSVEQHQSGSGHSGGCWVNSEDCGPTHGRGTVDV